MENKAAGLFRGSFLDLIGTQLGGGFNDFLFYIPKIGEMIQFDQFD